MCVGPDGRAAGEAFVELASAAVCAQALCRNRAKLGERYLELASLSKDEVVQRTNTRLPFKKKKLFLFLDKGKKRKGA
jgi:hypothetical protein